MSDFVPGSVGFGLHRSDEGKRHQFSVIVALLVVIAVALVLPPLSIEQQFWLIIVPVGVFGVSHGGADPWIVGRLVGTRKRSQAAVLLVYLLVSAAFLGLAWLSPVTALLVFLFVSIWHFGFTDAAYLSSKHSWLLIWLSGSTPIVGPVVGHPEQTSQLFAWLIAMDPQTVAQTLSSLAPFMGILWLLGLGFLALRHRQSLPGKAFVELILVATALVILPPLLAFTFYFCLIHTVRHFISIAETGVGKLTIGRHVAKLAKKACPATVAAIVLALSAWFLLLNWAPESELFIQGVRVLFWGLAALTLPHGLLVYLWWKKQSFQ